MDSYRPFLKTVRIYTNHPKSEPFILQFYNDTPPDVRDYIIKEAYENILISKNSSNGMTWIKTESHDTNNIEYKLAHDVDVYSVAEEFENHNNNIKKNLYLKDPNDSSDKFTVKQKENAIKKAYNSHNNSSSRICRSLGPKADIAASKADITTFRTSIFNYRNPRNKQSKVPFEDTNILVQPSCESFKSTYTLNSPDKNCPNMKQIFNSVTVIENSHRNNHIKKKSLAKNENITASNEISLVSLTPKNTYSTNNNSVQSQEKPELSISLGKIWAYQDNDIGVIPLDGEDPKIWSKVLNYPCYTFLEKLTNQPYNPKMPPPTYLPYSVLSQLKPADKEYILKGTQISSSGETICVDKEILSKQKGIVTEVLSKLAKNITEGKNVMGISLPVRIFEPRSMIERMVDWWSFMPTFLVPASLEQNPLERMKNVIAFAISGLYVSASQAKPFNPLLGETYQGFFPGSDIEIFCEHTSHHPPIANFLVTHSNFRFYGRSEFYANLETNTLTLLQDGPNYCEFKNDEKIVFYWPMQKIQGMLIGDRAAKWIGVMKFIDEKNHLKAIIKMDDGEKKNVFSKARSDVFNGQIYRYKDIDMIKSKKTTKKDLHKEDEKMRDLEETIFKITGSWLENLEIDGKEIWNINKHIPSRATPVKNPIPSDCRYREDLLWVKHGNLTFAEEWKMKLEDRQRIEKKLRRENIKERERDYNKSKGNSNSHSSSVVRDS